MPIKTVDEVKSEFSRAGIAVGAWAKANGFNRADVYAVLSGQPAKYGRRHQIAVALGLKEGVIATPETFLPARAQAVQHG